MSKKGHILFVEDSASDALIIRTALEGDYFLDWVTNLAEAETKLSINKYDLILLDVNLPDGNGYNFCVKIKENPKTKDCPVLFLTGRESEEDRVIGFSIGATDFIQKPVKPSELKTRVQNHLIVKPDDEVLKFDELEIHKKSKRVFIQNNEIKLTFLEFNILVCFLEKPDFVFSRELLIQKAWPANRHVQGRTVDAHVSKLRRKLSHMGTFIESVHSWGYRFKDLSLAKSKSA
jgi:DNA-binding response OmpR family regulator